MSTGAKGIGDANTTTFFRPVIERYVALITKNPYATIFVVTMITAFFFLQSARFGEQISADLEIYLPDESEESDIIKKIAKHWATNLVIIYIETENAYFPEDNRDNITDKHILDEISWMEGDEWWDGLNPYMGDRGEQDKIAYSLSLSILIKEINQSTPQIANKVEENLAEEIEELIGYEVDVSGDDELAGEMGHYAIPDNQEQIDQIVGQIPDNVLNSLVVDSNDDGIWDTTYIMFGVVDEVDDEWMRDRVDNFISQRPSKHTEMSQTGLIALMLDITDEAMGQLVYTMPFAFLFVVGVIFFFHRTFKILIIAGLPLIYTMIWTFGLIVTFDYEVSPIIVAAIPMLIGLGVDYALHIANRIAEFERAGESSVKAITDSLATTGRAVFLSAATTMIGFAALLISNLPPIRAMGFTLMMGISSCFFLTVTLVPSLCLVTKFRKKELAGWRTMAEYPVKYKYPIVAIVVVITLISLAYLPVMLETDTSRPKERNTGIESITVIRKFSKYWASGQSALLLIEGEQHGALNKTSFLDSLDELEQGINQVEYVNATTIVDIIKAVALNISWSTTETLYNISWLPEPFRDLAGQVLDTIGQETKEYYLVITYWDLIHWLPREEDQQTAIEIFYDALTEEAKDALMNEEFTMTLMIVNFPYLGYGITEQIIGNVNDVVDEKGDLDGGKCSRASGIVPLMIVANKAIMSSQYTTIMLSLVFVFIVLTFIFLSFKAGLVTAIRIAAITMIPIFLVVAWQPITMQGVSSFTGGASLNMMTAMVGSIIIGTGIDYAVHMSMRIQEEGETIQGIKIGTEHTGGTISEATFTTVAGLSGGLFVTWFRGFFSIIIALLLYALFAGMILLPAVYAIYVSWSSKKERQALSRDEGEVFLAQPQPNVAPLGVQPGQVAQDPGYEEIYEVEAIE